MQQVQKIACVNNGLFVMNFSIRWLDPSGQWQTSEWNSGNYPINQTRTSPDLANIGVPADALAITPYVHAILGNNNSGQPLVGYVANGQTAIYNVHGVTLNYSVDLMG